MGSDTHIVVIGAGIGGLSAAIDLSSRGFAVTLFERSAQPGGKMHEVDINGHAVDSGPTVFTLREVFDELFEAAGQRLDDHLRLEPADVLARHHWLDGSALDLYPDVERSAVAIAQLAGKTEASAYRYFARRSQQIFETLEHPFMRAERPGPVALTRSLGFRGLPGLLAAKPFKSMWSELGGIFRDPRLRQLFARYATYCGSSPLAAPATLMLIAHAERSGVWFVDGGMQRFAEALVAVARMAGVQLEFGRSVTEIDVLGGRVSGVRLERGESVAADGVIFNGDAAALSEGYLGAGVREALPPRLTETRSLSAFTWSMYGRAGDFPLHHHTVFFGDDYPDEFGAIFDRREITARPTVYVCAQDRSNGAVDSDRERLFVLVNAPARPFDASETKAVAERTFRHLALHGFEPEARSGSTVCTTPDDFSRRFPGSRGAIYGWPTHGWSGSFRRTGARTAVGGLCLAGGSVHPGPGVPMTALSGRLAAACLATDLRAGVRRP